MWPLWMKALKFWTKISETRAFQRLFLAETQIFHTLLILTEVQIFHAFWRAYCTLSQKGDTRSIPQIQLTSGNFIMKL